MPRFDPALIVVLQCPNNQVSLFVLLLFNCFALHCFATVARSTLGGAELAGRQHLQPDAPLNPYCVFRLLWNLRVRLFQFLRYIIGRSIEEMGKGPGLFSNIGKKARDLLTKDYSHDQKFAVTTYSEDGLGITSTGMNKGGLFCGDIDTHYKYQNSTINVKVDTNSNISTTITIDEVLPGAKTVLSFKLPDEKSGKLDFQYSHEHVGLSSSVGLTPKPQVNFSGAIGSDVFTVGGEVGFDTSSGLFTKYNGGIGITKPEFSAAILFADKGDTLKASYLHELNPITKTCFAAEISRKFSANQNTFTVGSSYALDPLTTMKTRLNNHGKLGTVLQHEWKPKSLITLSSEFDTKALDKSPKIGLALAFKP